MSTYSEKFKKISEKEACFEEAFVLLFEAIDELVELIKESIVNPGGNK